MRVGNRAFHNVIAEEVTDDYVKSTTIYTERTMTEVLKDKKGVIGRGLLQKMSLLLDFVNAIFLEANTITELVDQGKFSKNFIAIPFSIGRTGALICVETDNGLMRLSIDTGCTASLIRSSCIHQLNVNGSKYGLPVFTSTKFVIGGKDFGKACLHLYDITPELTEIDGILGMDFLQNQVLYIDYPNKMLYIADQS